MQRFVHSKWSKTKALLQSDAVTPYIPDTERMTQEGLRNMLDKYKMVYVKPDRGTYGNGVMRVEETGTGYRYQSGTSIHAFEDYDALYRSLLKATKGRTYLVQKGIHLLKYKGRRFDIRVMVQKNLQRRWETTGIIGRVAHPRKIVTNVHNDGKLKAVPALMKSYMSADERQGFTSRLALLGLTVAKQLESKYPGIKEIGIDVAVDQDKKAWILEVNTCPDPYIFRKLKDKSVFRRVARYARAYGRIK